MGKSWSTTIMKDQRLVLEEAEIVAAPESVLTKGGVTIGPSAKASIGDITLSQYTPEVRQTVSELIETVQLVSKKTIPALAETFSEAIQRTSEAGMAATGILGTKLQETQLGQASILPGMLKYLAIAAVLIIVAGKVWK